MHFKQNEEGIALITTLLMLSLMLILAMSAVFSSTTDIQVSRNVKENTRDIFVADAGLEWFKSQVSYYANGTFTIRNPSTATYNNLTVTSGATSKLFLDGLKWITLDGLAASAGAMWASPDEDACSATGSPRDASVFPLFYTSVSVGARTACLKIFSPVWEGIYFPRSDGTDLYYPRDHVGNYHISFDGSPIENINPSKPNFFAVRFPDVTSTETISVPQKSVVSDVRFIFGNNFFFFQESPYADPQTCNVTAADNPDTTCDAYDPNSATINVQYEPPAAGTNQAITSGNVIEGVITNIDDEKALIIYKKGDITVANQYIQGIARRYDGDPESTGLGTEDDTPYTFKLDNNGTLTDFSDDIGTLIDGENAETNCYVSTAVGTTDPGVCDLSGFIDANNKSYAGFIKIVKVGIKDGGCRDDIYVPYVDDSDAAVDYPFEAWVNNVSTDSQPPMPIGTGSWSVADAKEYSMELVDVADYMTALLAKLEEVNVALDAQCSWSSLTNTKVYIADGTQTTSATADPSEAYDFSIYADTFTGAVGPTLDIGYTVTHDGLELPQ